MERNDVFKCDECGALFEALNPCKCAGKCCGQEMELLKPKEEDAGNEKHVPVIEKTANGIKVKVGSVEHPMMDSHYIEWIQVLAEGVSYRKFLKPGDKPEAEFSITSDNVVAREHCNVHGLWKSK